jgi:putative MFS transporter
LFGSFYFFGVVISSMVFPATSDKVGRRPVLIVGECMQLVGGIVLLLATSKDVAYVCHFVFGLAFGARVYVGYIFIMEFIPLSKAPIITTCLFAIDGLTLMVGSFYFMYLSKSWRFIYIVSVISAAVALAMVHALPESPKFLISTRQFD